MASLLRAYNASLIRRPYLTQCATAAFLFGTGDIIAQQAVERKGSNHDLVRTARLTFYGGAIFGPAMTKWYQFLNQLQFKTNLRATIWRVSLDQAVITPMAVVVFFGSMATLEGRRNEIADRLNSAYVPTLIRNWGVFIPTQIINFAFVPQHLRFLTVATVSLFWNTYLSIANARQAEVKGEQKEVTEKVD